MLLTETTQSTVEHLVTHLEQEHLGPALYSGIRKRLKTMRQRAALSAFCLPLSSGPRIHCRIGEILGMMTTAQFLGQGAPN